jgi:large subunit ribosomal protein L31
MKQAIHPQTYTTKVHCNSCDTKFELVTTVPEITVEVCSNCHPFYTGKQKLLDTAGRVDKFKARQAEAAKRSKATAAAKSKKSEAVVEEAPVAEATVPEADPEIEKIEEELEENTISIK